MTSDGGREHDRSASATAFARARGLLGCEVAADEGPDGDPALVHVGLGHRQHESLALPYGPRPSRRWCPSPRGDGRSDARRRGAPQPHRRCDACLRTRLPGCRAQRRERRRRARFVGRLVGRRHQSGSGRLGGGGTACPLSALVGSGRLFASGGRLGGLDPSTSGLGLEGACRVGDDDRSLRDRLPSPLPRAARDPRRASESPISSEEMSTSMTTGTSPGLALICRVSISWSTVPSAR